MIGCQGLSPSKFMVLLPVHLLDRARLEVNEKKSCDLHSTYAVKYLHHAKSVSNMVKM